MSLLKSIKKRWQTVVNIDSRTKEMQVEIKKSTARIKDVASRATRACHHAALAQKTSLTGNLLCGTIAAELLGTKPVGTPMSGVEFKVFSQWGEDGIIQHLVHHIKPPVRKFVEFGVEDYGEANTRFLLTKDNWSGLILDSSEEYVKAIQESELYWKHDLKAVCSFVTTENIESLLRENGYDGEIGNLSIDVDGVDYWIWRAIECVRPSIVVVEYNSVFGMNAAVTVPRDIAFQRQKAHYSHLFYGASLAAFNFLADQKGYDLVAVNTAGSNAFFVRRSVNSPFPRRTVAEAFTQSKCRESRGVDGQLTFEPWQRCREIVADCLVTDVTTGTLLPLHEAWRASKNLGRYDS